MRREKRCGTILVLASLVLAVFAGGCADSLTGGFTPAPFKTIPFESQRAIDGSDAPGPNSSINVWTVKPDGTAATALTKFTAHNAGAADPIFSPDGTKLTFESTGAFDGSDSANTNSTSNVWVSNADGSGATALTKITAQSAGSMFPSFSPSGNKIVFQSSRALDGSDAAGPNRTNNIWVMNSDGSGATPVTKLTTANADSEIPAFSPDGSKILFESARALDGSDAENTNGRFNIWVVNADGTGATALTKLTNVLGSFDPVWSPGGTKVAFDSDRAFDGSDSSNGGVANVWVVNADGTGATALTKLTVGFAGVPVWSPDGSKIAFQSPRALDGSDTVTANNTDNIWVMKADGSAPTPVTKLTADLARSFGPVLWSPDSTKIVFESEIAVDGSDAPNTNNTFNIWIVNADGSSRTAVTKLTAAGASSALRLGD